MYCDRVSNALILPMRKPPPVMKTMTGAGAVSLAGTMVYRWFSARKITNLLTVVYLKCV